jgi:L-iditol 2-dehydrogenase
LKVGVYYRNSDVRVEERPVPTIGPGELLVKVQASGICGSDIMEWYRIKKAPRVLGHEISGDIVEVGKGVTKYKVGDRVFVSHHVPCDFCHYCNSGHQSVCDTLKTTNFEPGGFAEFLRVPPINVEKGVLVLPPQVSYEDGVFIEPLGCVVRAQRVAGMRAGLSVAVLGSGMSGLLHVQLARFRGASTVIATDLSDFRLRMAKEHGATAVINAKEDVPARIKELNGGRLADIVILCTGAQKAAEQAMNSVDRGGTIMFFAPTDPGVMTPLDLNRIWSNDITLRTSYAASPEDLKESMDIIASKKFKVQDLVTHRFGLTEIQKGFDVVCKAQDSLKVIIYPGK